jgi:hypothetical protein
MYLVDAFFANGVEVVPDGRCFVHGGGIEALMVPHVNGALPLISMLARIHFEEEECNQEYTFTVRATSPDSDDLGVRSVVQLKPRSSDQFPGQGVTSQVAVLIQGLPLPVPGPYLFDLLLNGQSIGQRALSIAVWRQD